ncbi:hypothetical protein VNO80_29675 [Phaseolus coccineus]|uniref:Uncharacterized protein n=1 Tax=Phaseolus coccineus TaxID=3886 RepID=A0AAN9LGD9_PHACN
MCDALLTIGPYLQLSRFQEFKPDSLLEYALKALLDGLPRLLESTNPCASVVHIDGMRNNSILGFTDVSRIPTVVVSCHVSIQEFKPDSLLEYALKALSDGLPHP